MSRLGTLLLCAALAACGGGSKKGNTTPATGAAPAAPSNGGQDAASMNDTGMPDSGGVSAAGTGGPAAGGTTTTSGGTIGNNTGTGGGAPDPTEPPIQFPSYDPDPAQAKSQVDQQLAYAKQSLSQPTPDADAALHAAREALKIDAASVEAAAYVAFAYYHKKQYDTAELVLKDLLKRPAAKRNATMYYVFGLVYDKTNRPEQAVLSFTEAVSIDPNFASALVDLGVHQLLNKQYDKAQQTFERLTKEMGRNDAVTLTSLGSAYRGRSADYPPGSNERNQLIMSSEAAYKRALAVNANYGPAYFNLAMLYLDADPFPSGGGALDTLQRLNAAKAFLDQYKNAPGVDIALYDERNKDVDKAIKREQKKRDKAAKAAKAAKGGT